MALLSVISSIKRVVHQRSSPAVVWIAVILFIFLVTSAVKFIYAPAYSSYQITGLSMTPNWWPSQTISGSSFTSVRRHSVYATSSMGYARWVSEHTTAAERDTMPMPVVGVDMAIKRVVGLPGDTLVFDPTLKTLISINGQKPTLSRHKKTKRQIIDGVSSSAFHADWSDANSTVSYAVYQMKELPAKIPVFLKTGLSTSYLDKFPLTKDGFVQITLSRDEYFLLSDNRTVGVDSRHYGPVHLSDIHSEVVTPPSMMKMMNE